MPLNKSQLFNDFFEKSDSRKIKYLVLHHICDQDLKSAIAELKKHKVSSHYIINDDGEIFQLVADKNIAYHAGISFWNGEFNLNSSSIGIEFFSKDPEILGFSQKQVEAGIKLCQKIIKKYKIDPKNIVGHSDIAYNKETGFLNRKDDPSHLFPWQLFAKNGVGIWPKKELDLKEDLTLFEMGNKNAEILKIKEKLNNFGYKITNLNDEFDEEFRNIVTVFNRRFNASKYASNKERWFTSSSKILEYLS